MREINLPQAAALVDRLTSPQAFFASLASAAIYYKGKIAQYPGERHASQPFKTAKQRRGFFAKLRAGEIQVPWRRGGSPGSEYLGRSWRAEPDHGGWTQTVGNPARYSSLVQGEKQSFYHKTTGWKTVEGAYTEEKDNIGKVFIEHFKKLIRL